MLRAKGAPAQDLYMYCRVNGFDPTGASASTHLWMASFFSFLDLKRIESLNSWKRACRTTTGHHTRASRRIRHVSQHLGSYALCHTNGAERRFARATSTATYFATVIDLGITRASAASVAEAEAA